MRCKLVLFVLFSLLIVFSSVSTGSCLQETGISHYGSSYYFFSYLEKINPLADVFDGDITGDAGKDELLLRILEFLFFFIVLIVSFVATELFKSNSGVKRKPYNPKPTPEIVFREEFNRHKAKHSDMGLYVSVLSIAFILFSVVLIIIGFKASFSILVILGMLGIAFSFMITVLLSILDFSDSLNRTTEAAKIAAKKTGSKEMQYVADNFSRNIVLAIGATIIQSILVFHVLWKLNYI